MGKVQRGERNVEHPDSTRPSPALSLGGHPGPLISFTPQAFTLCKKVQEGAALLHVRVGVGGLWFGLANPRCGVLLFRVIFVRFRHFRTLEADWLWLGVRG